MLHLNINTSGTVKFTNILEQLQKNALPTAIRYSLNDGVYNVKTETMPASARTNFTQRQKNFFTANSKFESAKGLDIKSMKATVGFFENKLSNASTNFAVKDLVQQESGGRIDGKAFIPMSPARSGGKGNVRPNARLRSLRSNKGIVVARNQTGKSKEDKFITAVYKAGAGGFVLGSEVKGENILWRVNSLSTNIKTKKLDLTPLYDYKKGRSVTVNPTGFMKEASLKSASRLEGFYIKNAQKQLKKYYGRMGR